MLFDLISFGFTSHLHEALPIEIDMTFSSVERMDGQGDGSQIWLVLWALALFFALASPLSPTFVATHTPQRGNDDYYYRLHR